MKRRLSAVLHKYRGESKNASWLLGEKVLNLLLNFVFFLVLARYLGPNLLGQYSIILSIFFLLTPVANLGLNGIVGKEFLDSKRDKRTVFGTCIGVRIIGSLVAALIALAIAYAGWSNIVPEQILVVGLLAVANIGRSLGVIDQFYKSQSQNKYTVTVRVVILVFSTPIKVLGIFLDWSLNFFLLMIGVEWLLTHLGYYAVLGLKHRSLLRWRFSIKYAGTLLGRSSWLVLSGLASYVYLKTDILMIAYFTGNEQAGYYSAATRLSEIWYFVPTLVLAVFYPKLQQLRSNNTAEYQSLLSLILKLLLATSFVIALMTALFSDILVSLFYGDSYDVSSSLIAIQVWVLSFVFVRGVYSSWLLLEGHYKYSLVSHLSGAAVNIVLNTLLIPLYAGQGAAWATLGAYMISSVVIVFAFQKTRSFAVLIGQAGMQLLMLPVTSLKQTKI